MIVCFNIEYRTQWGEEVCLTGTAPELGNNDIKNKIPLHTADGIHWSLELSINKAPKTICYSYHIRRDDKVTRREWENFPHCIELSSDRSIIYDCWRNIPDDAFLYSSAFTEAIFLHPKKEASPLYYNRNIVITTNAPQIGKDYTLMIAGNQEQLGNWNPDKALKMSDCRFPEYVGVLDADKLTYPVEYKFILYNKKQKRTEEWENNPNRVILRPALKDNESLILADRYPAFNFKKWKGAGMAIPVFSLRTEKDCGIGDFGDLLPLIDWTVHTGQKIIQLLPVNDTTISHTWRDSYPYNAISIYALHPIYTDIRQLGTLKDTKAQAAFEKKRKALNRLPEIDYEAVCQLKMDFIRLIYEQDKEQTFSDRKYKAFFKKNRTWLKPYAVFSCLRDKYHTANFRDWPEHTQYAAKEIDELCKPENEAYNDIAFCFYIQYHLHQQLSAAHDYARRHGIILKGDIPIGINRDSVEAWTEPFYFNLDGQAGAPPDAFSKNGQNWGFPTYNWDVMAKDGYLWWQKRFLKMSEYFDAYRIDHILGFFRIWEIPTNAVYGLLGHFSPALPLSIEEIEDYGFHFKEEYTRPYIDETVLDQLFGSSADKVKDVFLDSDYRLKPEYDSQRKIKNHFKDTTDEESIRIREGLQTLIANVLFIPDKNNPALLHPRISAQQTSVFGTLVPEDQSAFNRLYDDFFYHRHNEFWQQEAMKKLPRLIQATRMLVCGEDLGMIPSCVNTVMKNLNILSLEVQRMPKEFTTFGNSEHYPYLSVCTFSTHDMSNIRGWWEEDLQNSQIYYNEVLHRYGKAPATATDEICKDIVYGQLKSASMLCILSFQDWLSIDSRYWNTDVEKERINVPSNSKNYWKYRMHISIESLLKNKILNDEIKKMIHLSNRV